MANRRNTMLWMKDLIEHMADCHDRLQWADGPGQAFLAEALLGDLNQCRQLCEQLRRLPRESGLEGEGAPFFGTGARVAEVGRPGALAVS